MLSYLPGSAFRHKIFDFKSQSDVNLRNLSPRPYRCNCISHRIKTGSEFPRGIARKCRSNQPTCKEGKGEKKKKEKKNKKKMTFCVCVGCSNDTVNHKKEGVRFHQFPKDPKVRKAWEVAIGRTKYPKTGSVCSEHFTDDCYMSSYNYKLQHCSTSTPVRPTRPQLKPNAIPTIFKHKEESAKRNNSVKRIQAKEQNEVRKT